jgi:hypothetical protein
VEERARAYEEDVRILSREIAEAKRHPAGLGAASQATENALVAGDLTVLAQIAQQRRSPGLRKGAADHLARLARQGEAIEKGLAEIVKLQREETGDVVKSKKAARGAAARARAKLVAVGYVRRARASGTIKLRIKLKRSTLTRLSRGRSSITLNLRVSMVLPAHLLKGGVPVSSVRQVKLSKGSRRR